MRINFTPIGYVHNTSGPETHMEVLQAQTSEIVLDPKYADGLMGIGQNGLITIIFTSTRSMAISCASTREGTRRGPSRACSTPGASSGPTPSALRSQG